MRPAAMAEVNRQKGINMANQSSLRAFAELQSYCATLPATDEGRFERVVVSLIFDTGLARWSLADVELSAIDLDAGCLAVGDVEHRLSPFTLAAVRDWLSGGRTSRANERAKRRSGGADRKSRAAG